MLSDADRAFFDQNGYLIVRQLIPRQMVAEVVDGSGISWSLIATIPSTGVASRIASTG